MLICMYIRRCTTFIHTYVSPAHTTAFKNHPLPGVLVAALRRAARQPSRPQRTMHLAVLYHIENVIMIYDV